MVVSHQLCFRVLIINLWFEVFGKLFKNEMDPNGFRINCKFKMKNDWCWITVVSPWTGRSQGRLVLGDLLPDVRKVDIENPARKAE